MNAKETLDSNNWLPRISHRSLIGLATREYATRRTSVSSRRKRTSTQWKQRWMLPMCLRRPARLTLRRRPTQVPHLAYSHKPHYFSLTGYSSSKHAFILKHNSTTLWLYEGLAWLCKEEPTLQTCSQSCENILSSEIETLIQYCCSQLLRPGRAHFYILAA